MAMFGADVAHLRALARSFDSAADRLDQDRMSVGNAIRVQAWVGPVAVRFRAEWDSAHSARIASAAARLHEAARALHRNADDQERTSTSDGGAGAGVSLVPVPSRPSDLFPGGGVSLLPAGITALTMAGLTASVGSFAQGVHGVLSAASSAVELPFSAAEYAHTASAVLTSGRGAEVAGHLDDVLAASRFGGLFEVAGKTIGGVSVAVGVVDTITKASEGDTPGAVLAGVKTGLGIAAFAPPPVGPIAGGIAVGITVGEILSENPAITRAVGDVVGPAWDAVSSGVAAGAYALPGIAHDVGREAAKAVEGATAAAGNFLGGIARAAKKGWPW